MAKKRTPSGIPSNAANKKGDKKDTLLIKLKPVEAKVLDLDPSIKENTITSYVNLKYYDPTHECFSVWQAAELSDFSNFTKKLTSITWADIYKSAGKVQKAGLGYTLHKDKTKLPNNGNINGVSEEVTLFELRINQKARVHGFRMKNAFFLVWLDRNHQVYPQ